jgi:hypothetical protein
LGRLHRQSGALLGKREGGHVLKVDTLARGCGQIRLEVIVELLDDVLALLLELEHFERHGCFRSPQLETRWRSCAQRGDLTRWQHARKAVAMREAVKALEEYSGH